MSLKIEDVTEIYTRVKKLHDIFNKGKGPCEKISIRLAVIMEGLNFMISNTIKDKKIKKGFKKIIDQLNEAVQEAEDFVAKILQQAGRKPKRGRSKKASFKKKSMLWVKNLKNGLESEENQEGLHKIKSQFGDLVSTTNIAIFVRSGFDVQRSLQLKNTDKEVFKEAAESIYRIESRKDSMKENVQKLITKHQEEKEQKETKIKDCYVNKTPEYFAKTQQLPLKGGEILFNLIAQRKSNKEEGLTPRQMVKFMKLRHNRPNITIKLSAEYFFESWDLNGNGFLSLDEVLKNLQDMYYLASLYDYRMINSNIPFITALNNDRESQQKIEQDRLSLEFRYPELIEKEQIFGKMFANKNEITTEDFVNFCDENQDGILGELFYGCITLDFN
ncbi:hypothetical protein M0812_27546 [Anaeramoeba flamelloides]|uniref:EF-hand domain-containing protein n=1 Tax=Anaeramoeba flamelloides TaxID=1746091 RepID=A0AAV7Y5K3_9EUKA|nr:hypothetical protein M0812_27546 [Anaeramoeba flamelloides]